jgi:hypothetical protein
MKIYSILITREINAYQNHNDKPLHTYPRMTRKKFRLQSMRMWRKGNHCTFLVGIKMV